MRKSIVQTALPLLCLFAMQTMAHPLGIKDSVKISHATDGNISEWNAAKFETDKETQISYAVDHDANNLYVAVKVTNQKMQLKMMMQGMSLFVDKKGKQREGTGIEFPIKKDGGGFMGGADPKEMKDKMAATMIFLKTFGLEGQDDQTQLIAQPSGINVAFDWDTADNFYIEYQVPLSLIGSQASLNGKPLGIGWKINGMPQNSAPSAPPAASGSRGASAGGARNGRGGGRPSMDTDAGSGSNDNRFKDQSIWTKYVLTF